MKAAIYNPYLDTLGGGERYSLAFAQVLVNMGYRVDVEWKDPAILATLGKRFGMNLLGINIVDDIKRGDGYDVCFWVSDGSIPTLKSRNNFLHFQVPFKNVGGGTLINKMKLFRIKEVICNSEFTKNVIDREYGVKSVVIHPPVEVYDEPGNFKKENIILYVGRFSQLMQSKNQDVLVDTFKKLLKYRIGKWKLVLAGGVEIGVGGYIKSLEMKSKSFPVKVVKSPGFEKLRSLYSKAKIFWSASGYGVDDSKYPSQVEHFGITLVEAMSCGVIPLAYNAGGHKEIVKDGENGFLWLHKEDLVATTLKLIKNPSLLKELSLTAMRDSKKFSTDIFTSQVKAII